MPTVTPPAGTRRLPFTPTLLEMVPLVAGTANNEDCAARIITMVEALAAYIPEPVQDEAFREGLRAFRSRTHTPMIP